MYHSNMYHTNVESNYCAYTYGNIFPPFDGSANKFKHKCPAEEHSVRFLNLVDVSRLKATWPDSTLLAHFRSKPFLKLVQCMY